MAGPNISYHAPILSIMNRANTAPLTNALAEQNSQSFKTGTPVMVSSDGGHVGFIKAWDGTTVTAGILGISESFGLNLATDGAGTPGMPFGPISGTGAIQT